MLNIPARYKMEVIITGSLTRVGDNNVLMESRSIDPIVIKGYNIEDIFIRLNELKEYMNGQRKEVIFHFPICCS